ncbi:MAG TPA: alpha/beta hydrolase [Thermoanaerobaculia bacterium]|nr:alpha/beta hydrolase [Thermoanaerobaculia bacterium]
MPRIRVNGADLYYEEQGKGTGGEAIVFAHGLLWSGSVFSRQIEALADRYRCVAFDFRGQGRSETTGAGYDMETLAQDAAALIEALDCAPCHFVGLSMGGFVGMRLAIDHPELLRSLILLESSADPEPPENMGKYRRLSFVARWLGLRLVAGPVMKIMFGTKFLNDPARSALRRQWRRQMLANDRLGVTRAVLGVIARRGVYDRLGRIAVPTLVVVGDQDVATVPARAERIHAGIAGSRLCVIAGAGPTSTVEEPEAVNRALADFLASLPRSGVPRRG